MTDSATGSTSNRQVSPAAPRRPRRILVHCLKIFIAVVGLCFVVLRFSRTEPPAGESHLKLMGSVYVFPGFHWNDTAILPAGTQLRAVDFRQSVLVQVLPAPLPAIAPDPQRSLVRIRFPAVPLEVMVDERPARVLIDESTALPDGGNLGLPRELEVPAGHLAMVNNQHVQEGLERLLLRASGKWHLLAAASAMLCIPFLITAIRWRNLMRPQGIDMPLGKCLELTFVGQFYSIMLPGITGGDLVKIVYAARLTGSKTKSFITILLDRAIGLVALMVIAGIAAGGQLWLNHRRGLPTDQTLFNVLLMIGLLLLGLLAVSVVYFSRRLRRAVGIEWFVDHYGQLRTTAAGPADLAGQHERFEHLARVMNGLLLTLGVVGIALLIYVRWGTDLAWARNNTPGVLAGLVVLAIAVIAGAGGLAFHSLLVKRMMPLLRTIVGGIIGVDQTLHVYRGHLALLLWAFGVSVLSQLTLPISAWLCGRAFGMDAPAAHYLAYIPLAILAASLPISPPQGFGVLDWIIYHFFVERGTARAGQAIALAQAVRFLPILWNLVGAYWVITGRYSRQRATQEQLDLAPEPSAPCLPPPAH